MGHKGLFNGRVASDMRLCSSAALTLKAGKRMHLCSPQHYWDILRPSAHNLVAFIYSIANVISAKKVG